MGSPALLPPPPVAGFSTWDCTLTGTMGLGSGLLFEMAAVDDISDDISVRTKQEKFLKY
jgi:hypothetical protein